MLRHSPRRTPAFLAANRKNALKSTGPRTERGKQNSRRNATRTGAYGHPEIFAAPQNPSERVLFTRLVDQLRFAILPARNEEGERMLLREASGIWAVRQDYARRYCTWRCLLNHLLAPTGLADRPRRWQTVARRPGLSVPDWQVKVTISLRLGRGPGLRGLLDACLEDIVVPDLHPLVTVSVRNHPDVLEAERRAMEEAESETKPEYPTNERSLENVSEIQGASRGGAGRTEGRSEHCPAAEQDARGRSESKPEYSTKQRDSENVSENGAWWGRLGEYVTSLFKQEELPRDRV